MDTLNHWAMGVRRGSNVPASRRRPRESLYVFGMVVCSTIQYYLGNAFGMGRCANGACEVEVRCFQYWLKAQYSASSSQFLDPSRSIKLYPSATADTSVRASYPYLVTSFALASTVCVAYRCTGVHARVTNQRTCRPRPMSLSHFVNVAWRQVRNTLRVDGYASAIAGKMLRSTDHIMAVDLSSSLFKLGVLYIWPILSASLRV